MWSCINGFYSVKPTLISVLVNLQCFGFSYSINGIKRHQTLERWNEFSLEWLVWNLFSSYNTERNKQAFKLPLPPLYTLLARSLYPTDASIHLLLLPSFYSLPPLLTFSPPLLSQCFHWRMLPVHVWISPPIVHCCCRRNDPGEMCHCPGVQQLPTPWHSELSSLQDLKEQQ